ncbi:hypothetical protein CF15_05655 [Pyrodictium occultum]|uniref:DNA primase large subunit PriL n=1 Tax=Pyrodictium occultum TaxID=2309 RepID=A0A0V8RW09_PYROC|nr:hypothetical protein [Pyrodictium occultum]KSW12238.1 hypothetical protein CF15_05655 [Pyrodictium occultum]
MSHAVPAVIDTRLYPFLADPVAVARRRFGVGPLEVARLRREYLERAQYRLERAIRSARAPGPWRSLEEEVLSFYYAALAASLSGNRWLVSRLALAEANRAYKLLSDEKDEAVAHLGRLVGLRSLSYGNGYREPVALVRGVPVYKVYPYSMSLLEYLHAAKRLVGDDAWKPINLPVKKGRVYLEKQSVVRVVKEAVTEYVERRILALGEEAGPEAAEALSSLLDHVKELLSERQRPRTRGGRVELPRGVVVEEAFPPCIADLAARARGGEHLSHHERFALATFLLNIGADVDYVVGYFRNMPDFNERITRYQVEHLAGLRGSGKKYRVYSCEKMKTLGICKADCGTRSPVAAYYQRLRALARKGGLGASRPGHDIQGKS